MNPHPEVPPSPAAEAAYQRHLQALTLARVRVGALLAAALLPLGLFLDLATPVEDQGALLLIRGLAILGCGLLYLISRLPTIERHAILLSHFLAAGLAVGAELMLLFGAGITSHYYAGLSVVLIAVGLLFPWSVQQIAAFSAFFLGVYLLPALFIEGPLDGTMLLANAYFIANCGVVAVVGGAFTEGMRRREFFVRRALEDQARHLEEAGLQLAANLKQLKQLEVAKARFYTKVNHEFRTPLALIAAPLEELITDAGFELPAEVCRRLELMDRNVERLRVLVDQVIEAARIEEVPGEIARGPVELPRLVRGVVAEFEDYATARGARLSVEGECTRLLSSDPRALETILRNLLTNAIKFMPEGGEVKLLLEDSQETCSLTVIDHGIGIAEEDRERIFELFERIERPEGPPIPGSGVGLAIVRELVRQVQGLLEVTDTPGGGASFRLTLPRLRRVDTPPPQAKR